MLQGIQNTLGELPSGLVSPWTMDEVSEYIRETYLESDEEKERMASASKRLDLYRDNSKPYIREVVENVFNDAKVKAERLKFVEYATFQNVVKRVVNEISTVYSETAMRKVDNDNDQYQELMRAVHMDRKMRKANRYANLLNECLVMFRVVRHSKVPTLDVITPDSFIAIAHPLEPSRLVAVAFKIGNYGNDDDPHWAVWTDHETFQMNKLGRVVMGSYRVHGFGMLPGVLIHRELPDAMLMDPTSGEDLVSAHLAVSLLNVMMLKEQKSGTKAPYTVGDIGDTASGQALDSESVTVWEEGNSPGVLDLGSNPQNYIDATRSVINQAAANYGISESVFDLSYQATSGFEIELKRVGLREKRRDQILDFRPVERELAQIMSAVLKAENHPLAFDPDGWGMDFGEIDSPQDPAQRLAYWTTMRQMSLKNSVEMMMELNPEFTVEQAVKQIGINIKVETQRIEAMRAMQQLAGGPNEGVGDTSEEEDRTGTPVQEAEEV